MAGEAGITNLGPVPEGMSFQDAIALAQSERKYFINADHQSRRLTICETMREVWRVAETLPQPQRDQMQLLAGAGYDFGKRMDARMKELKALLDDGT